MKNRILQFINKIKLCYRLKKQGLAFVAQKTPVLKTAMGLLSFVRENQDDSPLAERIKKFLKAENSLVLTALYDELSSRPDVFRELPPILLDEPRQLSGEIMFYNAGLNENDGFYLSLIREITITDYPQLVGQYNLFISRMRILSDARFYGSSLEELYGHADNFSGCCVFEIDWIKTSKQNLYITFETPCLYTSKLPLDAQKNLSRLFARLFFERAVFISSFKGVGLNRHNQVCFLDFDSLYPVTPSLMEFAAAYIRKKQPPQEDGEFKLARAMHLLEDFCSDTDTYAPWKKYLDKMPSDSERLKEDNLLKNLQNSPLDIYPKANLVQKHAEDFAYLLDSGRHRNVPGYKKSSVYYWLPLLLMIIYLYYFF